MKGLSSYLIPILFLGALIGAFYYFANEEPEKTDVAELTKTEATVAAPGSPTPPAPSNPMAENPNSPRQAPTPKPEMSAEKREVLRKNFDRFMDSNLEKMDPVLIMNACRSYFGEETSQDDATLVASRAQEVQNDLKNKLGREDINNFDDPKVIIEAISQSIFKVAGISPVDQGQMPSSFAEVYNARNSETATLALLYKAIAFRACPRLADSIKPVIIGKQGEVGLLYKTPDASLIIDFNSGGAIVDKNKITSQFSEDECKANEILGEKSWLWLLEKKLAKHTQQFQQRNDFENGIEALLAIIKHFEKEDASIRVSLIHAAWGWKKPELAKKFYEAALQDINDKEKQDAITRSWLVLRDTGSEKKENKPSLEEWKKLAENSKSQTPRNDYAETLIEYEKYDEALAQLDIVLANAGDDTGNKARAYELKGQCYLKRNMLKEAEKNFRDSLNVNPKLYIARSRLGRVLMQTDPVSDEARKAFEQALTDSGRRDVDSLVGLGFLHKNIAERVALNNPEGLEQRTHNYDQALNYFNESMQALRDRAHIAAFQIGMINMAMYGDAMRASKGDPKDKEAQNQKLIAALQSFKTAVDTAPEEPEYRYRYGMCLLAQPKEDGAIKTDNKALGENAVEAAIELVEKKNKKMDPPVLGEAYFNLSTFYYERAARLTSASAEQKELFDKAWRTIEQAHKLGFVINKDYLKSLEQSTKRKAPF